MKKHILLTCLTILFIQMSKAIKAPKAEQHPFTITNHGDTVIDYYYWLNQYWLEGPQKDKVIDYLQAENDYAQQILAPTEPLQEQLYQEIIGRIKKTDESVPYFENDYWYITKVIEEQEYPVYVRRRGNMDAPDELLLDVNQMAEGHDYFHVSNLKISPDNQFLAYGVDTVGRRVYTTYFKNLNTGEILKDEIHHTSANLEWAQDSKTVFYSTQDRKTLRNDKVWTYQIGTGNAPELVFEEKDVTFYTYVNKTKSNRFIQIVSESTDSKEIRYIFSDQPASKFSIFLEREDNHLYEVDDFEDNFYILTNWDAENYRLMKCPIHQSTNKSNWESVIAHREQVLIEEVEIFKNYLVISEVENAVTHIRIIPWSQPLNESYIPFDATTYVAGIGYNPEFNTNQLRIYYQSLITPSTHYEYSMNTKEQKILKQQEVLGGFNSDDYITERLWATAQDGTKIPISIAYKKGFKKEGLQPLLLYGYGSYGSSSDPYFSVSRLSLLDRGFAYAIAHVRGGEEMGRKWYLEGKKLNKKNTFTDFIDCAEFLIKEGYTHPEHLYAHGGSAGGLLMGAIANMRPELWNGIISDVPFVDVLTTMLDETIPLTTGEYDEWGNPNNEESYFYIKSYSPYNNIEAKAYPNMMINTGLHDSQVQYFEPAKYVAKLRSLKTDDNILLLNCDMSSGHGGQSGRFQRLKEIARDYAFLLMLEKIDQ